MYQVHVASTGMLGTTLISSCPKNIFFGGEVYDKSLSLSLVVWSTIELKQALRPLFEGWARQTGSEAESHMRCTPSTGTHLK